MEHSRVVSLTPRPENSPGDRAENGSGFPEKCGADFSPDRVWRYQLWRTWDESRPYVNFLLLNPGEANETTSDTTTDRCLNYAVRWGYGGVQITNLFALVGIDQEALWLAADPIGRGNDRAIMQAARHAGIVVCAWGNHGMHSARRDAAIRALRAADIELNVLKLNGTGEPSHPAYLPESMEPKKW